MTRPRTRKRKTRQPVRGGLRGFSQARKPAIDLLRDIQTHVVAQGVRHEDTDREHFKIHVSELTKDDLCPRRLYYKVTKAERTNPSAPAYHQLEMIWAAGTAEHEKWQQWLREMGDLWGTWRCLICQHTWEDQSPECCPQCLSEVLEYQEVLLEDPEYLLVGHADGAVPRLNALVEIKSFSVGSVRVDNSKLVLDHTHKVNGKSLVDYDSLWKSVKRPLRSHLAQGMLYLWLAHRMGLSYDRIIYIYENKTTQATKTFEIKLSERQIRDLLDLLDDLFWNVDTAKVPPERPKLFDKDGKPCKDCVFRTHCWESDD